jgi:hypothetical protein
MARLGHPTPKDSGLKRARHLHGKFGRPRTPRRVVVALLLLTTLVVGLGFYYLTRPQRLASLAGSLLTDLTGATVQIASAQFGIGSIEIRDVAMAVPGVEGKSGNLFLCERVYIRHSLLSLLGGTFGAQAITFVKPTLFVTEEVEAGRYNYQMLRQGTGESKEFKVDRLPELFIREGAIEFGQVEDGVYSHLGRIRLSGNLTELADRPGSYAFNLHQEVDGPGPGPMLDGRFDLHRLQVHAELQRFALDSGHGAPLPRKYRKWWDQLQPEGALPTVRFGYEPGSQGGGFYAELEVRDMQLTLPYTESTSRMSVGSGRFKLKSERIDVTNLAGQIEGFDFVMNGRIEGLEADAKFALTARLAGVIDPKPRFVPWFPPKLQRQFHRFDPAGPILATVLVERKERGQKIEYDGNVVLKGMSGRYNKFPYPFQNVTGQIRFNEQRVEVVDFKGVGQQGGSFVANGVIKPPGDGAQVDMVVKVTDLPVDDMLLEAMEPKHRKAVEMFRDLAGNQRLLDENVVQTTAMQQERRQRVEQLRQQRQATGDAAKAAQIDQELARTQALAQLPVFDLGGRVNVVATVHRDFGPTAKYEHDIEIDVVDAQPLMRVWPFPVRIRGGHLKVNSKLAIARDIHLYSITGSGSALVNGQVQITGDKAADLNPDIAIEARGVPIDDVLLSSLPPRPAQWLRDLKVQGLLDAVGKVMRDETGITFSVDGAVAGASIQPLGRGLTIDQVAGRVTITPRLTTIHDMTGSREGGQLQLNGTIDLSQAEAACALQIGGTNLAIEPALLELLPPDSRLAQVARKRFEEYQPAGRFDAKVFYRTDGKTKAPPQVEITPRALEFTLRKQRLALREMSGVLKAEPGQVTLRDCQGKYDEDGRLTLSGEARLLQDKPTDVDLRFTAQNTRVDEFATTLVPPEIGQAITRFGLQGGYRVSGGHLSLTQEPEGQRTRLDATVDLDKASLNLGAKISELDGRLDVKADLPPNRQPPRVDLTLNAQRLLAADRLIAPLEARVRSDQQRLVIESLRGGVYGGEVVGQGDLIPSGQGRAYNLQVTLNDAALDPVVHPKRHPPHLPQAKPEHRDSGKLSASLNLSGVNDSQQQRSGRGEITIRDARMYELPAAMAMLQIINFAPPTAKSFDRADVSYLIDGDVITFDAIRLESPTVAIAGEGRMTYSTKALDLVLVTRNPGIKLGPVGDLMSMFKDELISVQVTGTLPKPVARLRSFSGIRHTWERIFGPGARTDADASQRSAQAK